MLLILCDIPTNKKRHWNVQYYKDTTDCSVIIEAIEKKNIIARPGAMGELIASFLRQAYLKVATLKFPRTCLTSFKWDLGWNPHDQFRSIEFLFWEYCGDRFQVPNWRRSTVVSSLGNGENSQIIGRVQAVPQGKLYQYLPWIFLVCLLEI
jgi:hypothetical protein